MYEFMKILKQDFMNLVKNPMWLISTFLLPILLVIVMGFTTSGSYSSKFTS